MVEILSQEEIEALLSSLSGDSSASPTGGSAPVASSIETRAALKREERNKLACEPYDFRRPDKFSKDQLRTMQMLHETFARLFASSLSAYLRVSTHVDLVSIEQIPYDEYMRSLTSSIITVFSMSPLSGQAILEMEFTVVLSMIDRLLGGPGNMVKNNNVLTDIEKALTETIIERALKELRTSWDGVYQFTPDREAMETQAQFIQIVPPNDIVVSLLFEIKIGDLRGAMSVCIPYLVLKPITAKLAVQRWFSAKSGAGQNTDALARRLESTFITCACRLGGTRMNVGELLSLKVGDTIGLDRECADEVELLIGDSVKFRGRPGQSGRKMAVHINRVVAHDTPGLA